MGRSNLSDDIYAKDRSTSIEEDLKDDWGKREPSILLLGTRDSGKKTFVKQVRIIDQGGFSRRERMKYRDMIHKAVAASARSLVAYAQRIGIKCLAMDPKESVEELLEEVHRADGDSATPYLSTRAANFILRLWSDPIIQQIVFRRAGLAQPCLMNFVDYFFSEALRLGAPGYTPSNADILKVKGLASHQPSVIQARVKAHSRPLHLVTIGDHRLIDRKKWTNYFDNVNGIIFCTAISDYNQEYSTNGSQKKQLNEAMAMFESIITSPLFQHIPVILFLNKFDLFISKLPQDPLENHFPKYAGGPNINKATQFIAREFLKARKKGQFIYPYITEATDTTRTRSTLTRVTGRILDTPLVSHWALL